MRINSKLKIRNVVGEHVVLLPVNGGQDMTRVIAINSTSKYLWDTLSGKDFTSDDVVNALLDNYEVDPELARKDAENWVKQLTELGVIE